MGTISILGCGWFGLHLAQSLITAGFTVKGSTTSNDKLAVLAETGITPFLLDLSTPIVKTDFFNCEVLVIAVPPKARAGQAGNYVPAMQRLVEAITAYGIQRVIFISATSVYGDHNTEVDEHTVPAPDTLSGEVLVTAENLFRNAEAFQTTILRFAGLVGPGRDPGRFFAGKTDIANGLAPVNLLHQADATGICKAVIEQSCYGYTVNACAPHHPARNDFYTKAAERAGLALPKFHPEKLQWKIVNSVYVKPLLGYEFEVENWEYFAL